MQTNIATIPSSNTVVTQQTVYPAPVVLGTHQYSRMNVNVIRNLGITHIVIAILTIGFGIGSTAGFSSKYWVTTSSAGIWGGAWILVTGIIGVLSSGRPQSGCLNGFHMALCIITTFVTFIDGIFFCVGIGFYNNCKSNSSYRYYYNYHYFYYRYYRYDDKQCHDHATAGKAIYSILLLLMITEFFVALVASIYCCQATSCCNAGTSGTVLSSYPTQHIVVSGSTNQGYVHQQTYPTPIQSYGYPPQQFHQTTITAPISMSNDPNFPQPMQYPVGMIPPPPPYHQ